MPQARSTALAMEIRVLRVMLCCAARLVPDPVPKPGWSAPAALHHRACTHHQVISRLLQHFCGCGKLPYILLRILNDLVLPLELKEGFLVGE